MPRASRWHLRNDELKRLLSSLRFLASCQETEEIELLSRRDQVGIPLTPEISAGLSDSTTRLIWFSVILWPMLSSVPTRLIARRSRSLSPCSRVLQTSASGAACRGSRETPPELQRNPIVSTSRVSRRGILADESAGTSVKPLVQYHHLAPRWLSHLENRRGSWAALADRGRDNQRYWEESGWSGGGGGGGRGTDGGASRAGAASVGVLSAAALAFCLKKDSDNKGTNFVNQSLCCLT